MSPPRTLVTLFASALLIPVLMGAFVEDCDCGSFGGSGGGGGTPTNPGSGSKPMNGLFTAAVTEIRVEVDYEPGAEPYTGSAGLLGGDVWDLFDRNVKALFTAHPKTFLVDRTLAAMEKIPATGRTTFTVSQILDLADAHRQSHDEGARRTFYILYLNGRFQDQEGVQPNVLGVSIGHTGVIAMFKPVVAGTGSSAKKVEQTTLIHELGHAVGLVDNGVSEVSEHRDDPHGAHCTNTKCIMYWLNESSENLVSYVVENVLSNDKILFDQSCIDDVNRAAQ